ncbi:sensor histidine kinase [Dyadobacter subterraneus]|uniref:Histidine kinase n=1 Tax=Dyadobacter subterraneus TaxID=2773304 RepID=A0ABR9W937_9BACT|nr:histidine kinase [Dyadobacter subterraneus]MBE9461996.1 histidine kinase [Dyadobacter subterraneus]
MKNKVLSKSLNRLSWMLALLMSGIACLILLHEKRYREAVLYTVLTAFTIALIGFVHVKVMVILSKQKDINPGKFKRFRFLSTYLASAVIYLIVWPATISLFSTKPWIYDDWTLMAVFAAGSIVINSVVLVLHDTILMHSQKMQLDLELTELKAAHTEAANLLLKQQIHPHFLFNALNTVKVLYNKNLDSGDTYLVHLAGFLRASIFNRAASILRLDQELMIFEDYLQMQKIRFGAALFCVIDLPEQSLQHYYLPSFSLQPLLENAIKHNELTEHAPLHVLVEQQKEWIVVSNNLQKKLIKTDSTNSGLANLSQRYKLMSGSEVIIEMTENKFSVSLKLLSE